MQLSIAKFNKKIYKLLKIVNKKRFLNFRNNIDNNINFYTSKVLKTITLIILLKMCKKIDYQKLSIYFLSVKIVLGYDI